MYNKNSLIKYARNTLAALMTAPILVAGNGDLVSRLGPTSAEAVVWDWGIDRIGVDAIRKVIPEGQYEVRAWNSESDKIAQHFLYVINQPGQARVPFRNEPAHTVTDLKLMDPQGIEKRILVDYSSVVRDPYSIEVHEETLKNGDKVYFVRKRNITPKISFGKLYLEGPGTPQAPGGPGGTGGTGSSGGGAPGGGPGGGGGI